MSNSDSSTNLTLLGRLQKSPTDHDSWAEFVERYGAMINNWCRGWGLQPADAQDVTQNVLLKIANHMKRFEYRKGGRFRSWLRTVAFHAWCDYNQGKRKEVSGSTSEGINQLLNSIEAREDFLRNIEEECDRNLLEDAMSVVRSRVEAHTWNAFLATAIEGRPGPEVAESLDMNVGTVYVAKSKVQKMLREEVHRLDASLEH